MTKEYEFILSSYLKFSEDNSDMERVTDSNVYVLGALFAKICKNKKKRFVTISNGKNKIYAKLNGFPNGCKNLKEDMIINASNKYELLDGKPKTEKINLKIKNICLFNYFLHNPDLYDRVSFIIAIVGFILGIISLIVSILLHFLK